MRALAQKVIKKTCELLVQLRMKLLQRLGQQAPAAG